MKSRAEQNRELRELAAWTKDNVPVSEQVRRSRRPAFGTAKGKSRQKSGSALGRSRKGGAAYDHSQPQETNLIVYRIGDPPPD